MAIPLQSVILSILTVPPFRPTNPNFSRQVMMKESYGWDAIKGSINVVLYFRNGSGSRNTAWIRDSLSLAFLEAPLLCGRLRRGECDNGALKIVTNDCGARLVEGTIDASLEEFISRKSKDESLEPLLVFWNELDEESFQLSALFCVQVTRFKCGGYAIGIAASVLMADYIITDGFIQRWAGVHRDLVSGSDAPPPLFNLPHRNTTSKFPDSCFRSRRAKTYSSTTVYKISTELVKELSLPALCLLGVEETEKKLCRILPTKLPELTIKSPEVRVETCDRNTTIDLSRTGALARSSLNELGMEKLEFVSGEEAVIVSYSIANSNSAFVMALASSSEGSESELNILVNVPN